MTVTDLLLTDDRQEQLTAALANTGIAEPLVLCLTEAAADVARFTAGYVIAQSSLNGWTRALALWKAFTLAELGVPEDVQKAYEAAMDELTAIAKGERPNIPQTPVTTPPASAGAWGSRDKLPTRSSNNY